MVPFIISIDRGIFTLINGLPHNFLLDGFFSFLSGIGYFGAVWLLIAILLMVFEQIKNRQLFYSILLSAILTLLLVEVFLKNLIRRSRPEFILGTVKVVDTFTKSFSFPSGHATISFAAAYILAKGHPRFAFYYFLLAALISFSRIYLGKHYPSDVIAGIFFGSLIGIVSEKLIKSVI